MSAPACRLQRWLRPLAVLLALLCGSGAHEVLHHLGAEAGAERPSAPFEAHDQGCPHRGDAPVHEHSLCVLCKSGGPQHATLPPHTPQAAPVAAVQVFPLAARELALAAPTPGSIGARAPPSRVG